MSDDAIRERIAKYLFERTAEWRHLASSEDADWDEWVERNQEEWLQEADALLAEVGAARRAA